jgi:hypothetical protein
VVPRDITQNPLPVELRASGGVENDGSSALPSIAESRLDRSDPPGEKKASARGPLVPRIPAVWSESQQTDRPT